MDDQFGVPGFDQTHNGGTGGTDAIVAKVGPTSTSTPTPTLTPTATSTSTPTPTATVPLGSTPTPTTTATASFCAPRPSVGVTAVPTGDGRLGVTLRAQTLPATPANALSSLRIGFLTNAQVSLGGAALLAGQTVPLPPGTQEVGLVVQRLAPGQASTAQMVVTDACGDWPTFVGGGPTAF
jgi:hypothetical protein